MSIEKKCGDDSMVSTSLDVHGESCCDMPEVLRTEDSAICSQVVENCSAGVSLALTESVDDSVDKLKGVDFLLVDDNLLLLRTFARSLSNCGGNVVDQVLDGTDAVDVVDSLPVGAVVLLDDRMVDMHGREAAPLIRKKREDLTIIMVSGTAEGFVIDDLISSGVLDLVVHKPVPDNFNDLILQYKARRSPNLGDPVYATCSE